MDSLFDGHGSCMHTCTEVLLSLSALLACFSCLLSLLSSCEVREFAVKPEFSGYEAWVHMQRGLPSGQKPSMRICLATSRTSQIAWSWGLAMHSWEILVTNVTIVPACSSFHLSESKIHPLTSTGPSTGPSIRLATVVPSQPTGRPAARWRGLVSDHVPVYTV